MFILSAHREVELFEGFRENRFFIHSPYRKENFHSQLLNLTINIPFVVVSSITFFGSFNFDLTLNSTPDVVLVEHGSVYLFNHHFFFFLLDLFNDLSFLDHLFLSQFSLFSQFKSLPVVFKDEKREHRLILSLHRLRCKSSFFNHLNKINCKSMVIY